MNNSGMKGPAVYPGIFALSAAALLYEMTLTRFFSVYIFYHFGFMVVSIALLGSAAGSLCLYFFRDKKPRDTGWLMYLCAVLFTASSYLCVAISGNIPFNPYLMRPDLLHLGIISAFYIVLCLPFFFFGLCVSAAFERFAALSNTVYFCNLAGSAAGCLLPFAVYRWSGFNGALAACAASGCAAAFLFLAGMEEQKRLKAAAAAAVLLLPVIIAAYHYGIRPSPYKSLELAKKSAGAKYISGSWDYRSKTDIVVSPLTRFAPGLSLKYGGAVPAGYGVTTDGDNMITLAGSAEDNNGYAGYLPMAAPYAAGIIRKVLIIRPSGDTDISIALKSGAEKITCVEADAAISRIYAMEYRKKKEVAVVTGNPRVYLKAPAEKQDLIVLTLARTLGASATGNEGLAEDHLLVRGAFKDCIAALDGNGFICVTSYLIPPPRAELKLTAALIEGLTDAGAVDAARHIFAFRTYNTYTCLAKKTPLLENEIAALRDFCESRGFAALLYPGAGPAKTADIYAGLLERLALNGQRKQMYRDYLFDIRPATEDRPYFNDFYKLGKIRETYRAMKNKWRFLLESRYFSAFILVQAVFISCLLMGLPYFFLKKAAPGRGRNNGVFFFVIGLNFMFVEIAFMQRFSLILGNPFLSMSLVLVTLLLAAGAGSYASGFMKAGVGSRVRSALAALAVMCGLTGLILGNFTEAVLAMGAPQRALAAVCMLLPFGFALGIPFPNGIKALGQRGADIPAAWCVNGCASVTGSVLAALLAAEFGYKILFFTAAALYVAAFLDAPGEKVGFKGKE